MKKLFAGILSVMLVFALSGCDNAGNSSDNSQSSQSSEMQSEAAEPTSSSDDETSADSTPNETPSNGGKTLVVVYSASGNTKAIADYIVSATGADLFEITPTEPYTSDDLNWTDPDSRVSREHDDESLRDVSLPRPRWKTGRITTRCLLAIRSGGE